MAKAVASGMPKMKIEESAARRQARIDSKNGKRSVAEDTPRRSIVVLCMVSLVSGMCPRCAVTIHEYVYKTSLRTSEAPLQKLKRSY